MLENFHTQFVRCGAYDVLKSVAVRCFPRFVHPGMPAKQFTELGIPLVVRFDRLGDSMLVIGIRISLDDGKYDRVFGAEKNRPLSVRFDRKLQRRIAAKDTELSIFIHIDRPVFRPAHSEGNAFPAF